MSVDRLSEFRQSFAKNRHLAVRFGMIPIEVPSEALKEVAEARGYVVEGETDEDGGGIYSIRKVEEEPEERPFALEVFDMKREMGLVGLYVQVWNLNRFFKIFLDESDNQ